MESCNTNVWGFDIGKASLGEAVRIGNEFKHVQSLILDEDFADTKDAAKLRRQMRTRRAHKAREHWLEKCLSECGIEEADVISLQLPSQAAFHLMACYVESDYEMLNFTFRGESNCIDTWMYTRLTGKPGLSIGCRGDRATGALADGEVRVTMTTEGLLKALDSLDRVTENGILYPYNPTCLYADQF